MEKAKKKKKEEKKYPRSAAMIDKLGSQSFAFSWV